MKPEEGLAAKLSDRSYCGNFTLYHDGRADERLSEPSQADKSTSRPDPGAQSSPEAPKAFLPKVLKTTKQLLASGCFYFSYDYDLTTRLSLSSSLPSAESQPDTKVHGIHTCAIESDI